MNIVKAEVAAGKRLVQVGFMRPYDAGYRALKKVIDDGQIGDPLIVHCAHRNPAVGDSYKTDMAITDTVIHEIDVLRWLLGEDYASAQVVYPKKTRHASAHLADPQIVLLETVSGVRTTAEANVNCQYGYDIQCRLVGESGIISLPDVATPEVRKAGQISHAISSAWFDRFIEAYDREFDRFFANIEADRQPGGKEATAWDGYVANVVADAALDSLHHGGRIPVTLNEQPALYR